MNRYENLEQAMCKELDRLNKKYAADVPEMATQDVQKIDLLYHALKSAETYYAMKEASEWDDGTGDREGRSYRRGRDSMGRYTSRDMEYDRSGHYPPMMYPRYPSYSDGYRY